MNRKGATLIEVMVAVLFVSLTAYFVFPIVVLSKKTTLRNDFRVQCENLVKMKLAQYTGGRRADYAAVYANDLAVQSQSPIAALTLNTFADNTNNPGLGAAVTRVSNSPFDYAKLRYNIFRVRASGAVPYHASICAGQPINTNPLAMQALVGVRECLMSQTAFGEINGGYLNPEMSAVPGAAPNCGSDLGLPGFKLFVRLKRVTPWSAYLSSNTIDNKSVDCPSEDVQNGFYTVPTQKFNYEAAYDFNGQGDGIEIQVTGVMDYESAGLSNYAGITDVDRLSCVARGTIYPERFPFRYYLSDDGEIRSTSEHTGGQGTVGAEHDPTPVFRGVQFGTAFVNPNTPGAESDGSILSFAVHPLNYSIYVLKRGQLTRYSECGGLPLDCVNTATPTNTGISDRGYADATVDRPNVQVWQIDPGIVQFAMDFKSGRAFGLSGNRKEIVEILASGGGLLRDVTIADGGTIDVNSVDDIIANGSVAVKESSRYLMQALLRPDGSTVPFASLPDRFTGFFLASDGEVAYFSAKMDHAMFGQTTAIYRNGNQLLTPDYLFDRPVKTFSP